MDPSLVITPGWYWSGGLPPYLRRMTDAEAAQFERQPMSDHETLSVTAAEWVDIRGVGLLAIVSADQIPTTPKPGDSLMIDGSPYTVIGVERQPSNPPRYVINGFYGLMVQPQSRGAADE